ncbi:MAG: prephenate dehydrogenase/arogenate dehydrogenase family protein [Firmicutes bacterium]|nr:prephenate dehydrogenase/arogenate dehydrogenase family protein [Bacillota bacterium]
MKIAIAGIGKMGAWFAVRLSESHEISVFDTDEQRISNITENGSVIKVCGSLKELAESEPDMFINAVSLQNTIPVFEEAAKFLPGHCILCDIASVKGDLPEYYDRAKFRFVSVHPMFGPTFANLEALKEENAILVKESDPDGLEFFRKFFTELNLTIFEYTFDEHDDMMAYSLSLPFISTMVFTACMKDTAVPGSTFAKHRKIAGGLLSEDDRLLSEILFNRFTIRQLEKVTSRLEFLKHIINGKDYEEAKRFYDRLRSNI